jgi:hypothetical protein
MIILKYIYVKEAGMKSENWSELSEDRILWQTVLLEMLNFQDMLPEPV